MKFATKTIHSGHDSTQHSRAVMPPIYQTSVFEFAEIGEQLPFAYARTGTPPVPHWKAAWPAWKTPSMAWLLPAAWRRSTPCCAPR